MLYNLTLGRAARLHSTLVGLHADHPVSFRDLARRVERVAGLLHERGFRIGDRLAILLLNCPEFVEIIYACARLGVIAVPLNTRYALPEVDAVLNDCAPKGIIRHSTLAVPTKRMEWEVILDQSPLEGADTTLPPMFYDPEAIFGLFYTSGTTGKAKGVMLTHGNLNANNLHSGAFFGFKPGDCWLHSAPMFHLADFPGVLLSTAQGVAQAMLPRFDPGAFCEAVERYRVTHTVLIPTMINFLTMSPDVEKYDLSSLSYVLYGGSPIAPEVLKRARAKLPNVRFGQGYGMTETSPIITILDDDDHTRDRALSCGRTPYGIEAMVGGLDDEPLAPGVPGEILSRGPHVMKGYWNQPEETAKALRNGWMHTGDVGYQDEEGYYYIVDRSKDMIVTGGENVYSTEVEAVIYEHPAIKEAAIIGIPDVQWGELVTACVVIKDGSALTSEELAEHCRARIANYKVPRRVEFFPIELPKSGTGKILKRALREPFWKNQTRSVG